MITDSEKHLFKVGDYGVIILFHFSNVVKNIFVLFFFSLCKRKYVNIFEFKKDLGLIVTHYFYLYWCCM